MKTKTQPHVLADAEPDAGSACLPLLAGLSPLPRAVVAGTTLFRQGDHTVGIYVLLSGALRLQRVTPDGAAVTLHQVRPGEMFAEASLFATQYHCDAIAESDSVAGLYPKSVLVKQLRRDPEALWNFSAELARRLQGLRQRYELKQIRSAPQRVLQFLRLRCDVEGRYYTQGTLKDIAAELGLTHEALYRTLAALEQQGRIARRDASLCLIAAGKP
ncbi:MAG: Crp/Fnr family transcriptional regulator [Sulfuritalea sp.]|nr:Crp/Fnr family transcriptional regulator [Sulfuritalea sp.]